MDERNLEPEHPAPRRLVDELGARLGEVRERGADVLHLVGDVVHPRTALGEEAADRRVLAERTEQLEPTGADAHRRGLDPLFLDPRTVLEPRSEQPLVRRERAVEVVDGQPHVMDRAGNFHEAIVCERIALTMRTAGLGLVLAAVLLAGCGGGKKAAQPNGEASKPAAQVLADTKKAATSASSMHVDGHLVSSGTPLQLDLHIAKQGATGSMTTNGLRFDLIRIGDTFYIRGTDAFYKKFAGQAAAQLLHGKWLKGSASSGKLQSLAPLTSSGALFGEIVASHGKLENVGETTYQGQKVVEIRDTSDNSKLYVSATGTPYPVAIVGGKKSQQGAITFDSWNQSVSLNAPKNAIDLSLLGAG